MRVIDDTHISWLNVSGSGNETATHLLDTPRMTLMFAAFDADPLILRVYGAARTLHPRDTDWDSRLAMFPAMAGSRQIFDLAVELVQTSCGTGVPVMSFERSRGEIDLLPFYANMGPEGVVAYWKKKNSLSIDGKDTGILMDE